MTQTERFFLPALLLIKSVIKSKVKSFTRDNNMGIAKEIYDKMAINQEQPIVMTTGIGHANVYEPYERFKEVVEELEKMEDADLVKIHLGTTSKRLAGVTSISSTSAN
jgi:hypothetical protein